MEFHITKRMPFLSDFHANSPQFSIVFIRQWLLRASSTFRYNAKWLAATANGPRNKVAIN